ncbi:alpha/beta hydrolase [Salinisphaera hydrothermalis]|nr:alpha/beta hydrolase [Salinisphaera hydrothermalis]
MSRRGRQRLMRAATVSLLGPLLAACSGQFWVNTLVPRWGYDRHSDIAYGDQPRQKLDVYAPDKPAPGHPVVVFFYGGSWQTGNKDGYRFVGEALASRGITAVLPDYRLYPQVKFPTFVDDGAAAVAWTRAHIADYGGDACHLFVAGHSAGAHIAAMLATNATYLNDAGASVRDLSGFIGLSGPYDFLPIKDPALQKIFAPKSEWPRTQPIHFVDGNEPPMLLLHGGADTTVLPKNTTNLAAKVNEDGGSAKVKIYPGVNHVMLLAPLAAALRFKGDELDRIADFVNLQVADRPCSV